MKKWILGTAALAVLVAAGPVHAITVDDVIGLTRADASDAIIMSKIEADGTVFHLTVDEILALKQAGVSDAVITYMINTGKLDVGSEEQVVEEIPAEEAPVEEYVEEDPGYYSTSLDAEYRDSYYYGSNVSFSIGFGWYYPYWPGFSWSFYYGPYRYCWRPYYYWGWPYYCGGWYGWDYGWGYGYGYGCGYCGGYVCRSYHYPSPYYGKGYARVYDGRNLGNRGSVGGGRVIKDGATPYESTPRSRANGGYEARTPSPKMVSNNSLKAENRTNRVVPGNRGSSRSVESPRNVRVIRSRPAPVNQRSTSSSRGKATYRTPNRNNTTVQKPTVRTRTTQKPTQTRTTQKPTRTRTTQKPAKSTSRPARSYAPSRSSNRSSFSGSRGSSGGRGGGSRGGGGARGGGSRSGKP